MLKALRKLIDRWLGPAPAPAAAQPDLATLPLQEPDSHLEPSPAAAPHPAPYDEHLFERSRTQWQFGDWDSLVRLAPDTLAHHPDRAKLALLAATAHGQLGNTAQCRQLVRQALDWGCPKKLVSQVLIAGVHNTLGRATVLGNQPQRALRHFEAALATGTPGADLRLLAPTLARHEIQQLGLPVDAQPYTSHAEPDRSIPLLGHSIRSLAEQLQKQNTELTNLRKHLEKTVKQEMLNATQQLEAFLDIQSFLNHGEHLPSMHGWPVSPDFARYLIELIEKNDYDLILEFGSGTSTVIIAKALVRLAQEREGKAEVVQVAFEHLPKYHTQTLAQLQTAQLDNAVQLVLAPLQPYAAPNGKTYAYYDCHQKLAELAAQISAEPASILMVVDGPPGSTGKHARYPALPAALAYFKNKKIDIVLDDYFRADEKEVAVLWQKEFELAGYETENETIKMEKDAYFISGTPASHSQPI